MNIQNCLEILREIKDVAFATVDENGEPQVRIIDVMIIEKEKFYFCTARGKEFYQQLTASGNVAVTGLNQKWQMVRLSGKAYRLAEQKKWIDRIFEENPSMKEVYPGESVTSWSLSVSTTDRLSFLIWGNIRSAVRVLLLVTQNPS